MACNNKTVAPRQQIKFLSKWGSFPRSAENMFALVDRIPEKTTEFSKSPM